MKLLILLAIIGLYIMIIITLSLCSIASYCDRKTETYFINKEHEKKVQDRIIQQVEKIIRGSDGMS